MEHTLLQAVVWLLAATVLVVSLFRRLHLPTILAYLAVGIMVGPQGFGVVSDLDNTRKLAEYGLVFLLFTLGLEFSWPQLYAMRREVLGIGSAQVIVTTALAATTAYALGLSLTGAIVIGGVLAMSSTAIVIKQLGEQLEGNSRHGRLATGILLFQDLAVVVFLIVIPALHSGFDQSVAWNIVLAIIKGGIIMTLMYAVGHWVLRPFFHEVVSARSAELFTLTVLLFSLAAAWLTQFFGLSLALGAFLAGMMLGETEFRHQVEIDIRPFRDILLGLFFVTVGMLLDIAILPNIWPWVLAILGATLIGKIFITALVTALSGAERGVALRTGIVLAQGGEFGFVLLSLAIQDDYLPPAVTQMMLATVIISMVTTPLLVRYNGRITKFIFSASYGQNRRQIVNDVATNAEDLQHHIMICGFGRVGQNIARFIEKESYRYFALDLDAARVKEARAAGQFVTYGDSTHPNILEAAGLQRAKALVISFDDAVAAEKIILIARKARADLPILVRTRDDSNLERLQQAGATEVVPETLEASLMLVSNLLYLLNVPVRRIVKHIQDARADRYQVLHHVFKGQDWSDFTDNENTRMTLHSVLLPRSAHAVGKRINEINLSDCGVSISAIRRGDIHAMRPLPDIVLQVNDVVILYGDVDQIEHAENLLLRGN
ncbi:MAG: cation:proton antiporter [Pseudomonadota bacterium]